MDRRALIVGGIAALVAPFAAEAQPATKVPRIGMLLSGSAPSPAQPNRLLEAFRGGLRDLRYIEGQNVLIEYRWSRAGRTVSTISLPTWPASMST